MIASLDLEVSLADSRSGHVDAGLPGSLNLLAHYDAYQTSSLTLSSNSVTQWLDLSGNGNHLSPSGNAPVYSATALSGAPGANFGNSARMVTQAFSEYTTASVFFVAQLTTSVGEYAHACCVSVGLVHTFPQLRGATWVTMETATLTGPWSKLAPPPAPFTFNRATTTQTATSSPLSLVSGYSSA